ncbi:MAG: hypothetical protein AAFY54_00215 [Cyanobacteria bacterium J06648_10]
MSPSTDTQTEPGVAQSIPASKQDTSGSQASDKTLGYEVLYGRQLSGVQVPLSLSQSLSTLETPKRSTGSALLDSLVGDRRSKPVPLRNLTLVGAPKKKRKPTQRDIAAKGTPPTAPKPAAPKPAAPKPAAIPAEPQTAITKQPANLPKSNRSVVARPMPSATVGLPEILPADQSKTQSKAHSKTQLTAELELTDEPELTDELELTDEPELTEIALTEPALRQTKPQPTPPAPSIKSPQIALSATQQGPAFSHAVGTSDKEARDSAASVGLLDLEDALLFGGEQQDLFSTDPLMEVSAGSALGVLTYITLQVSAFTVSKPKGNFPYNTDPAVINRVEPPKRKTVLDLQHFQLGSLTNLDEELPRPQQTQPPGQAAVDISALSQQVKRLNQKIADLSQKLAQVTDHH